MLEFKSIEDFSKFRKRCIFCNSLMKTYLTQLPFGGFENKHYLVKQRKFTFTAEDEDGEDDAIITVDPKANTMVIDLSENLKNLLPGLDVYEYQDFFIEDPPYLERLCTNKKCKSEYYLTSLLTLKRWPKVKGGLIIDPFNLTLEGFRSGNYTVMIDYDLKRTNIYSLRNIEAPPIILPVMDFSSMSEDKIINRVRTLVTFS